MSEKRARNVIRGWDRMREVTGYGRTQLQQMVAEGRFPKPIKLGPRAIGFFEDEIAEWQQDRLAARERKTDAE